MTTITTEFVLCAVTWGSNTQGIPNITNAAPCRTLQHDPMRNEDLATDSDDHAADALRYGCMARSTAPSGEWSYAALADVVEERMNEMTSIL